MTREENELITRTGPGTPMGDVMRSYWIPAALSSELPDADGAPVRVRLLGERLIAFRDTQGRVGILDEFCAHRRASLFLGRNEECGLRCVYHGWKFDVDGNCVDMPNEPTETCFKDKIRLKAYPTLELGGVIWSYMGPRDKMPPPPKFEWTQVPERQRFVSKTLQECNWLQALEGGFDDVHASFLHSVVDLGTRRAGTRGFWLNARAPKVEVELTDYGYLCGSIHRLNDDKNMIWTAHFVMPFHQIRSSFVAGQIQDSLVEGHMWVPVDDENCMVYNWMYAFGDKALSEDKLVEIERARGRGNEEQDEHFRKIRNKDNDWRIDRGVQKHETFTGIEGINTQDHAITESMGPIVDRSQEHLGSTDRAVLIGRHVLIQAARKVEQGSEPLGIQPTYYGIRAMGKILPKGVRWVDAMKNDLYRDNRPQVGRGST
jgi:phenylpropionate dioxygenase-like ring-hydroxylating dioxygenase large terminal subunit